MPDLAKNAACTPIKLKIHTNMIPKNAAWTYDI